MKSKEGLIQTRLTSAILIVKNASRESGIRHNIEISNSSYLIKLVYLELKIADEEDKRVITENSLEELKGYQEG